MSDRKKIDIARLRASQDEERIVQIIQFWKASSDKWFSKDAAFDQEFEKLLLPEYKRAAEGLLEEWMATADGALALIILLDQFPRNAFRNTLRMFATDTLAVQYARRAMQAGFIDEIKGDIRAFLIMPYMHAEDLSDQDMSVKLFDILGQPWLKHAKEHREIISRFGRFAHRNGILGRQTTAEEQTFLDGGGFQG